MGHILIGHFIQLPKPIYRFEHLVLDCLLYITPALYPYLLHSRPSAAVKHYLLDFKQQVRLLVATL